MPGSHWSFVRGYVRAVGSHWRELTAVVGGLAVFSLAAAVAIWWLERNAQPDEFGSLGACIYWAVITITTVGYGDMSPVTAAGRALAVVVSVVGVGFLLISAGILATAFVQGMEHFSDRRRPHCGQHLDVKAPPRRT